MLNNKIKKVKVWDNKDFFLNDKNLDEQVETTKNQTILTFHLYKSIDLETAKMMHKQSLQKKMTKK